MERSFPMVGAPLDPEDRTASLSRAEQLDLKEVQADVREAYERGRRDERASRRRHPVFMTITFAAALCGIILLALAAIHGSFAEGGRVAARQLSAAANRAEPQVRNAASDVKAKISGAPG